MSRSDQLEAMMAHIEQRVLDVLAELPEYHTMSKRDIQRRVYGTDVIGASHVYSALGRLKQRGEVVERRWGFYKLADSSDGAA